MGGLLRAVPLVLSVMLIGASGTPALFVPARYRSGPAPVLPVTAPNGGTVFLEVAVDADGRVAAVKPLLSTPPFTQLVVDAVRRWRFEPARDDVEGPIASTVLVAAVFRSPTLYTLGLNEPPADVAVSQVTTPVPMVTPMPVFPPGALQGGVVVLEAMVGEDGTVARMRVIRSAPPFDAAARDALQQWRFQPAVVRGVRARALACVIFGFPQPVTTVPKRD
jgi:TonB family protein